MDRVSARDLDGTAELAELMVREASTDDRPAVVAWVNGQIDGLVRMRLAAVHTRGSEILTPEKVTELLDQYVREQNTTKRKDILDFLCSGQLPDKAADDVMRFIKWALSNGTADARCVELLNCFVGEASFKALLALADVSEAMEVRLKAIRLVSERRLSEDQLRSLGGILKDEADGDVRAKILFTIIKSGEPGFASLIRQAASDPSENVRAIAVSALDATKEDDERILLDLAQRDSSDRVRLSVVDQLQKARNKSQVVERLLVLVTEDKSEVVRERAVLALANRQLVQNQRVLELLRQVAFGDPSIKVRTTASDALERLGVEK